MSEPCYLCGGSGVVYEADPFSEGEVNAEECSCQKIGGYVVQPLPSHFNIYFRKEIER